MICLHTDLMADRIRRKGFRTGFSAGGTVAAESEMAHEVKRAGRILGADSVRFNSKGVKDCLHTAVAIYVEGRRFKNTCRGGETAELITLRLLEVLLTEVL